MTDKSESETSRAPRTQAAGKLFVVLTPPSGLAVAVLHAVQAMAERALGPVDLIKLSTIDALREEMKARKNQHLLLYSDCPAPEAADLIRQAAPPVFVFADDPVRVAQSLQGKLGPDPLAAIRTTALSYATLHELVLQATQKLILAPHGWSALDAFLSQIAAFFEFPIAARDIKKIADKFSAREDWADANAERPTQAAAGSGIISPFASLLDGKPADKFFWPPALFFGTEPLGSPLAKKIDLTGPARPLLYGPYMHLPVGQWEVQVRFTVAENRSGNALLAEWMSGNEMHTSARINALPAAGQFQFVLPVEIEDPREPLQLRLSMLEGAIEGEFEFHGIEIFRHAN
ncbi:MAG: hypothetical protein KDJ25_01750 [Rhodoblastus sp.]|nr:hypothetical protein [Rhodoblastus sp.]